MPYSNLNSHFEICYKALIGGLTVLIIYFAADSCKLSGGRESCEAENKICSSVTGFEFVCDEIPETSAIFETPEVCQANPCCENGPNPLCCQNGVCNNENFVFNTTLNNTDDCQCLCTDNFAGLFIYAQYYIIIIKDYS